MTKLWDHTEFGTLLMWFGPFPQQIMAPKSPKKIRKNCDPSKPDGWNMLESKWPLVQIALSALRLLAPFKTSWAFGAAVEALVSCIRRRCSIGILGRGTANCHPHVVSKNI